MNKSWNYFYITPIKLSGTNTWKATEEALYWRKKKDLALTKIHALPELIE